MAAPDLVRVAIIGFGHWGPNYARILSGTMSGARLTARAEADDNLWLRDGDLDAVIVAPPTSTHREVTEACLRAGAHVLVEKPLASTVADAESMMAVAEQAQRTLMVGHTFLFNPAVRAIKGYIDEGRLGKIRYLYFQR